MVKKKKKANDKPFLTNKWQRFEYKHTVLALCSIVAFVALLDTAFIQGLMQSVIGLGYLGIFLAGLLFVSFFTAAPAVVLLLQFADVNNPFLIGAVAGLGAALGDLILFKFFEEKIGYELKPLAKKLHLTHFIASLHRKKARLRTILVGSFIIASPLPDEIGIGLLGLSHISSLRLFIITFALNSFGIFLVALAA